MKLKYWILTFLGTAVFTTACEEVDESEIYEQQFHKILYLKQYDEQQITLYNTGENGTYTLSVIKAGTNPELTASANISVMNDSELESYCAPRGLDYVALPQNLFSLDATQLDFSSADRYKIVNIALNTTEIANEFEANADKNYVIPLQLKSETDSINSSMNVLFVKPTVVTPTVNFTVDGIETFHQDNKDQGQTFDVALALDLENKWDFECTAEVDKEAQVFEPYRLLPEDSYEILNGGKVSFKNGETTAHLQIKTKGLSQINGVIPIKLTGISNEFDINTETHLVQISINPYPLTAEMLSTNLQEPSEGPIEALLDNNTSTYFHSTWSQAIGTTLPYLQVSVPEALEQFQFCYTNRASTNGMPYTFTIMAGPDADHLTEIKKISNADNPNPMPLSSAGTYTSSIFTPDQPIKVLRLICTSSSSTVTLGNSSSYCFALSEFKLYGF